jgi:ABC-type sugar transport system permease subunit
MIVSPIVVALVFSILLNRQFGLVNLGLQTLFGVPSINWLGDPTWAKVSVGLLIVWRWTGYLSIFFLAGLQSIPSELYESASIDGAGPIRKFINITIPMLKPVTAFVAVTMLVGSAQLFDEPYLLTQGGPGESTLSIAIFIFRAAFKRQTFGYASAAAVVLFLIVFTLGQLGTRLTGVGRAR